MMLLKKYGAYLVVLAAGLVLGYMIFGNSTPTDRNDHSVETESQKIWICSMDPQVRKSEKGDCPICGMELIKSAGVLNTNLGENQFQMTENALALSNIETTTIGSGAVQNNTLMLSGIITSNEKTNAIQTTLFNGRIEKLNVNYVGDYVKKGQQLGLIYSPEMYKAQDQLLTSASYKDTHKKIFKAARNTLGIWKMTDEQVEEVIRTGKPMTNFPLYADVSGTVTEIMASEGNFYKQGDPLYKVSNLYTVWAIFDAYENQLPMLKVGQKVTISSSAFKNQKLKAKISFIDPVLNLSKRTVSVRVTLNNKDRLLKPGMFIEGGVEVVGEGQVLTVPKSSVLWTGKRSLVYVKPDADRPVFEMTEVTLGNAIGNSYVILGGLAQGDEIVTNGTFTVDAAAQLQGKKSMITNNTSKKDNKHKIDSTKILLNFNEDIKKKFIKVIDVYIDVKNALVETDAKKTSFHARTMFNELKKIDLGSLNSDVLKYINTISKTTEEMANSASTKEQRTQFKPLSESMVALTSSLSGMDHTVYVQFCPMADGNKGGSWLSFESKVLNPYFGEKMLSCGSVTQTIQ